MELIRSQENSRIEWHFYKSAFIPPIHERHWKQREKQIQRVVKNTVGLYGDMQGIIGGQIPTISALELENQEPKQLPSKDENEDEYEEAEEED